MAVSLFIEIRNIVDCKAVLCNFQRFVAPIPLLPVRQEISVTAYLYSIHLWAAQHEIPNSIWHFATVWNAGV